MTATSGNGSDFVYRTFGTRSLVVVGMVGIATGRTIVYYAHFEFVRRNELGPFLFALKLFIRFVSQ